MRNGGNVIIQSLNTKRELPTGLPNSIRLSSLPIIIDSNKIMEGLVKSFPSMDIRKEGHLYYT